MEKNSGRDVVAGGEYEGPSRDQLHVEHLPKPAPRPSGPPYHGQFGQPECPKGHTSSIQCGSLARGPLVRAAVWGSGDDLLLPGLTHEERPAPRSIDGPADWPDRHEPLDDRADQSSLRW